ncbi:DUF5345 family protein [Jeotgalibacillus sp. ET6]|uniref:DUF5345 family protein n=1 Tax=Jeotgalibacillus sp. ET6 TaxID=3037260 RepID=UPI0024186D3A|nr:DUF5345 family protein [Jeotgalibacillus sp. ET6]MDG5473857.1 DUF5345 family protein [Jeotgalibacillus sp. ET6]
MDQNKRLEHSIKEGLRGLDKVETHVPSVDSMKMLVHQTKKRMRMELYLFMAIALLLAISTVVFIMNSPAVYLMIHFFILLLVSASGAVYFYKEKVHGHE